MPGTLSSAPSICGDLLPKDVLHGIGIEIGIGIGIGSGIGIGLLIDGLASASPMPVDGLWLPLLAMRDIYLLVDTKRWLLHRSTYSGDIKI